MSSSKCSSRGSGSKSLRHRRGTSCTDWWSVQCTQRTLNGNPDRYSKPSLQRFQPNIRPYTHHLGGSMARRRRFCILGSPRARYRTESKIGRKDCKQARCHFHSSRLDSSGCTNPGKGVCSSQRNTLCTKSALSLNKWRIRSCTVCRHSCSGCRCRSRLGSFTDTNWRRSGGRRGLSSRRSCWRSSSR